MKDTTNSDLTKNALAYLKMDLTVTCPICRTQAARLYERRSGHEVIGSHRYPTGGHRGRGVRTVLCGGSLMRVGK